MSCVLMLQRGHSGDGCVLASTLCKYDFRNGDLFVLSWARVRRVRRGSLSSELLNKHQLLYSIYIYIYIYNIYIFIYIYICIDFSYNTRIQTRHVLRDKLYNNKQFFYFSSIPFLVVRKPIILNCIVYNVHLDNGKIIWVFYWPGKRSLFKFRYD